MFPEIGRVEIFLSLTLPHIQMCIRIYIFNFKKHQTNKQKKTRIKKAKQAKQTKEEKRNLRKIDLKKEVCIHSGEDFSRQPHFRKQE